MDICLGGKSVTTADYPSEELLKAGNVDTQEFVESKDNSRMSESIIAGAANILQDLDDRKELAGIVHAGERDPRNIK